MSSECAKTESLWKRGRERDTAQNVSGCGGRARGVVAHSEVWATLTRQTRLGEAYPFTTAASHSLWSRDSLGVARSLVGHDMEPSSESVSALDWLWRYDRLSVEALRHSSRLSGGVTLVRVIQFDSPRSAELLDGLSEPRWT